MQVAPEREMALPFKPPSQRDTVDLQLNGYANVPMLMMKLLEQLKTFVPAPVPDAGVGWQENSNLSGGAQPLHNFGRCVQRDFGHQRIGVDGNMVALSVSHLHYVRKCFIVRGHRVNDVEGIREVFADDRSFRVRLVEINGHEDISARFLRVMAQSQDAAAHLRDLAWTAAGCHERNEIGLRHIDALRQAPQTSRDRRLDPTERGENGVTLRCKHCSVRMKRGNRHASVRSRNGIGECGESVGGLYPVMKCALFLLFSHMEFESSFPLGTVTHATVEQMFINRAVAQRIVRFRLDKLHQTL